MDPFDVSWMIGRRVHVRVSESGHQWFFALGDSAGITVECPWRVLRKGKIRLSGEDHNQKYGLPAPVDAALEANKLLNGAPIVSAELRRGPGDLLLDFEGDLRLEMMPFSGYEAWQFSTPDRRHVLAGCRGELSTWVAVSPNPAFDTDADQRRAAALRAGQRER
jgi:hypothetical protein